MSRFQKIFFASALVVVGFGVAKFLGQPVLPKSALGSGAQPPTVSAVNLIPVATASAPQGAGRIRLLPDSSVTRIGASETKPPAAMAEATGSGNALASAVAATEAANNSSALRNIGYGSISSAPIGDLASPSARLRNEAPRAVGVDPQSPAAIRRLPSDNVDAGDPYRVTNANGPSTVWSAPQLLNTGYSENGASPPATPATYTIPVNPATQNQVAPPPWLATEEATEQRTHIVVDGDSLQRLASRYLSDPARSREIYELNRQLLSSPDLLPIGAELKIPDRVASSSWDRRGFEPNSANARPTSEVGRETMMPIRPASSPQGIIPRAQLAPPVMVQ